MFSFCCSMVSLARKESQNVGNLFLFIHHLGYGYFLSINVVICKWSSQRCFFSIYAEGLACLVTWDILVGITFFSFFFLLVRIPYQLIFSQSALFFIINKFLFLSPKKKVSWPLFHPQLMVFLKGLPFLIYKQLGCHCQLLFMSFVLLVL